MLTRSVSSSALCQLATLFLVVLVAAACAPTEAPDAARSPEPVAAFPAPGVVDDDPSANSAVGTAVRVVYRDPATGELTSTPPEGVAPVEDPTLAERGVGDFHRGAELIRHDNGMLEFTRPEGFRMKLVATLDEDGNLTVRHSTEASPGDAPESEEVTHAR